MSYHLTYDAVRRSAAAFDSLGITKGDHVAVFAENSAHWLFADQGIQLVGGATVVRGADAPIEELRYIYDNSDANEVVGKYNETALTLIIFLNNTGSILSFAPLQFYKGQLC